MSIDWVLKNSAYLPVTGIGEKHTYNLFINMCCDQTKTKSMTLGFMCAILPSLSLLGKYSCFILICHFITRIFNIECFKYPIYKNVLKTLSAIFQFLWGKNMHYFLRYIHFLLLNLVSLSCTLHWKVLNRSKNWFT